MDTEKASFPMGTPNPMPRGRAGGAEGGPDALVLTLCGGPPCSPALKYYAGPPKGLGCLGPTPLRKAQVIPTSATPQSVGRRVGAQVHDLVLSPVARGGLGGFYWVYIDKGTWIQIHSDRAQNSPVSSPHSAGHPMCANCTPALSPSPCAAVPLSPPDKRH